MDAAAQTALVQVPLLDVCWRSGDGGARMRSALRELECAFYEAVTPG